MELGLVAAWGWILLPGKGKVHLSLLVLLAGTGTWQVLQSRCESIAMGKGAVRGRLHMADGAMPPRALGCGHQLLRQPLSRRLLPHGTQPPLPRVFQHVSISFLV